MYFGGGTAVLTHPLGDGAELRALEPWRAEEFAAHVAREREHLAPWLPWARSITDAAGARAFLQSYADRQAADEGRIYGLWVDGTTSRSGRWSGDRSGRVGPAGPSARSAQHGQRSAAIASTVRSASPSTTRSAWASASGAGG